MGGVCEVQKLGLVHRDIKLQNIFIADSGDLVLGDFGIVFFQQGGRQTTTFEMVGSHFWMAPWAYKYEQLALRDVTFALDVYPLGKVLWSMIAGRRGFPREDFERDEYNLAGMSPDPAMPLVNDLLKQCVVREEKDCIQNSLLLLNAVERLIADIKTNRRGNRPDGADTWPCRVCGVGRYHRAFGTPYGVTTTGELNILAQISGAGVGSGHSFSVYVCDHCKHAELFGQFFGR